MFSFYKLKNEHLHKVESPWHRIQIWLRNNYILMFSRPEDGHYFDSHIYKVGKSLRSLLYITCINFATNIFFESFNVLYRWLINTFGLKLSKKKNRMTTDLVFSGQWTGSMSFHDSNQ